MSQPQDVVSFQSGGELFPDRTEIGRLRRNLGRWYQKHARNLPWRRSRDPYRVWVSEIMLQQTTVAAVAGYFERFLKRFPTVHVLAAASEHDVMRLWEGLGYYSRALNLQTAARQIVTEHQGTIPSDVNELMRLRGIGRYTAGAIASLAYDRPAPIVEANTLRVYSRLLAFRGDPHSTAGKKFIWSFAERAVPGRQAGMFNQALMDLGALVCTPAEPNCPACPVRSCCRAFREGIQGEVPQPKRRPTITYMTEAMIAVCSDGRYLLRMSPRGERWAGLWEFLRIGLQTGSDDQRGGLQDRQKVRDALRAHPPTQELSQQLRRRMQQAVVELCGLTVDAGAEAFELHHSVTRYRIRLLCTSARCVGGSLSSNAEFRWAGPKQFGRYALSAPARRFAGWLTTGR